MPKLFNYKYDKQKALKVLSKLENSKNSLIYDDKVRTTQFLEGIFNDYFNKTKREQVKFAFVIPTRASRFDESYWAEVYDFFPALRHLDSHDSFIFLSSIPPFAIEMYGNEGETSCGVLIFSPVFSDMLKDFKNKLMLARKVRHKINETVNFAVATFGVEYVGLGATLPKLTKYGKLIKVDVVTTTGHAGTAYLIVKTVDKVLQLNSHIKKDMTIGFIGGGAIGLAAMMSLAKKYPDATFITHDKRDKVNINNKIILKKLGKELAIASSNKELLNNSQLIISAITSTIKIDDIDLSGKIIIDDSQPGSFLREEVIACGGELIWVVGSDKTKKRIVTRRQGYSYGINGLHSKSDVWGCEAEVAAIAQIGNPDIAIKDAVSLENIDTVGEIFDQLGIDVADFQSHGQINT